MSGAPSVCTACGEETGLSNLMPCGEGGYLCRDCAEAMLRCFRARGSPEKATLHEAPTLPAPAQLVAALDQSVIGQRAAKGLLAVAAWKHLQRMKGNLAAPKAHVLLYGPTGCGKTHLARRMAALLDVPFATVDATALTETGYRGKDVRDILVDVLDAAQGDLAKAEHALVFVDEFDKLAASGGEQRAAYQHGTQHGFLTLLEGGRVTVDWQGNPHSFDTSGLLFLFAGAFSGLEDIISARLHLDGKRPIGFGREDSPDKPESDALLLQAISEDFVRYGIEAELMGRIPIRAPILPLTEEELIQVLTQGEGSICGQYGNFFRALEVDFSLSPAAAQLLAHEARESGSGARGLKGQLERAVTEQLLTLPPGSNIHITPELLGEEVRHESEAVGLISRPCG